jgi:hypothetical protein
VEARGQHGLTGGEVSLGTNIRAVMIEESRLDYDACGGDIYVRGNIASPPALSELTRHR